MRGPSGAHRARGRIRARARCGAARNPCAAEVPKVHYLSHLPRFSETLNAYKLRNYQAEGLIGQVSKLHKKRLVGVWVQPGL